MLTSLRIIIGFTLVVAFNNLQAQSSAVVLMYHHFGDDTPASTSVTLAQFDAHLDYLAQHEFNVWPLSKLVHHLQNQLPIPPKTVALTADDAYKSVYSEAYPRLKARGWSITTFVNSEPIDKGFGNFMTWQQMREMQAEGFEFANHTHTHSKMRLQNNETEAQLTARIKNEINTTQQRLQTELGLQTNESPRLFAYPYGEYSETAANLIREMGYISFAQHSGAVDHHSDLRALSRFPMAVSFAKIEDFRLKVNTLPLPVEQVTPWNPIVDEPNPPTLTLMLKQPIKQLACYNSRGENLKLTWLSEQTLQIVSPSELKPPRNRYACTAPAGQGRWYWYSHLWIIN